MVDDQMNCRINFSQGRVSRNIRVELGFGGASLGPEPRTPVLEAFAKNSEMCCIVVDRFASDLGGAKDALSASINGAEVSRWGR